MKQYLAELASMALVEVPSGAQHNEPTQAFRMPSIRTSKRYPEQSSRQAMRNFRRQQGGPGIVLNTHTGQYEPRI